MGIHLVTDDGRMAGVSLPPANLISSEPIASATDDYREAQTRSQAASAQLNGLRQRSRAEAVRKDSELLADALQAGKPDPGQIHTSKVDDEITNAARRIEALSLVEQRQLDRVRQALDEHGDQWTATLADDLAQARADYLDLVEQASDAIDAIVGIQALIRFTEMGRFFQGGGLTSFDGRTEVSPAEALAALRAFVPEQARGPRITVY